MSNDLSTIQIIFLGIIALLNVYTYGLFYTDKKRSIKNKRNRIPEAKLLLASFMAGGIGALLGMYFVRHKTKHRRFQLLVPLAAATTILVVYFIVRL